MNVNHVFGIGRYGWRMYQSDDRVETYVAAGMVVLLLVAIYAGYRGELSNVTTSTEVAR